MIKPINNSTRFCVLWLPTTQHRPIAPLSEKEINDLKITLKNLGKKVDHLPIFEEGNLYLKDILISDIVKKESSNAEEKTLIKELPDYLKSLFRPEDIKSLENGNFSEDDEKMLYLDLTLKANSKNECMRDIEVICKKKENGKFIKIWNIDLKCEEVSRNGLVKYIYDVNSDAGKLLDKDENLIHALYHAIKGFYHIHEFQDEGKDSILKPYSTENPKEDRKSTRLNSSH